MIDSKNVPMPTDSEIATYAYYLWESEGRLSGRDLDYWLQAKAHLIADRQYEAGLLEKKQQSPVRAEAVQEVSQSVSKPSKKRSPRARREPAYA